jgi:hypothetical protein
VVRPSDPTVNGVVSFELSCVATRACGFTRSSVGRGPHPGVDFG